jgi:hypothetical protein
MTAGGSGTDSPGRLFRAAMTSAPEQLSGFLMSVRNAASREITSPIRPFAHADFPMPIPLSTATMLRVAFQGYCVLAISR